MYVPLEHSENLDDQKLCVKLMTETATRGKDSVYADILQAWTKYAESHRDVIVKFGRFPHRNEVMGRQSTPEEIEYLKNADRYGQ